MTLRLVVGAATDVGRVRDHNEDGYLVDGDLRLVAVADGMGGHLGGEVASATALETLHSRFTQGHDLRDSVVAANDAVYERSTGDDAVRGMGTTLTAGVLADDGETLILGHVGDSRAYLLRAGELQRITTDHSLVEELMQAGELTEEEAERDPRRSMITRALGLEADVEVDLYPVALQAGDRLILCSDGLTTMLREEQVAATAAAEPDPDRAAQELVDGANAAGGVDNITVVVVDVVDVHDDEILEAVAIDEDDDAEEDDDADADDAPADGDESAELDDGSSEPGPEPRRRRRGLFRRRSR
jgi:serine/threonine protein phosphatase PrpC